MGRLRTAFVATVLALAGTLAGTPTGVLQASAQSGPKGPCCDFWVIVCVAESVLYGDHPFYCIGWYDGVNDGFLAGGAMSMTGTYRTDCTTTFSATGTISIDGSSFALTAVGPAGVITTSAGGAGSVVLEPTPLRASLCDGALRIRATVAGP